MLQIKTNHTTVNRHACLNTVTHMPDHQPVCQPHSLAQPLPDLTGCAQEKSGKSSGKKHSNMMRLTGLAGQKHGFSFHVVFFIPTDRFNFYCIQNLIEPEYLPKCYRLFVCAWTVDWVGGWVVGIFFWFIFFVRYPGVCLFVCVMGLCLVIYWSSWGLEKIQW